MTSASQIRRELMFFAIALLLLSGAVVWVRTATVKATYQYVRQEAGLRQIEQEIQRARVEWLEHTSPRRLEVLAQRLGLRRPSGNQVLKYGTRQ